MARFGRLGFLLVLLCLAVAGCAGRQYPYAPVISVSDRCERLFERWHLSVETKGRMDVQDWSPPGFPYLRVDRFLASFDLTGLSPPQRRDWLTRSHTKAVTAWRYELQGGPPEADQLLADLRACSQQAITAFSSSAEFWPALQQAATVPDSYSTTAQVFGLYPLVTPIVRWRASVTMGELAHRFGRYDVQSGWRRYGPVPERSGAKAAPEPYRRDSLGIPVFSEDEFRALVQRHAPSWRIDTRDSNDVPGVPGRSEDGRLQFRPEPVVFTQLGFTFLDGAILPQLTYVLWFPARPPEGVVDIYAGALDGVMWRVTMDQAGQALVYDTIHPCGCYHQWLLVDGGLRLRPDVDPEAEQLWVLGSMPGGSVAPVLSLSAGDHQLVAADFSGQPRRRVKTQTYRLEALDRLRGATHAGGRLYGADGLIAGTERPERFLLWPSGVVSAGAMRQWGHHAVSFVGRRHFDKPFLLNQYFTLP